ncbi:hypothetical protein P9860_026205 [Escherichia coli]|uniref:hypothetical protein n=1 Tax=Escherichia coli TaxID=562 RepID=UPI002551601A|nr:hypothetical protein [Escherichia coli]MEC5461991.1 hypothetical protein [Escherichia coli]
MKLSLKEYIELYYNTQRDFASALKVTPQQVTKWLRAGWLVVDNNLLSVNRELPPVPAKYDNTFPYYAEMRELNFKGTGKLHAVCTILRQNRFDPKTKNSDYDIYVTAKIEYQGKERTVTGSFPLDFVPESFTCVIFGDNSWESDDGDYMAAFSVDILSPKQLGLDIGLEYFKYLEDQFCAAAFNFLRNADMTQNDVKDTESAYRGWLEIDEEDLE